MKLEIAELADSILQLPDSKVLPMTYRQKQTSRTSRTCCHNRPLVHCSTHLLECVLAVLALLCVAQVSLLDRLHQLSVRDEDEAVQQLAIVRGQQRVTTNGSNDSRVCLLIADALVAVLRNHCFVRGALS